MRTHQTEASTPIAQDVLRESSDPSVLIVDGYDVSVCVRGKQLRIEDGINSGRRTRIVCKADRIRRIVILTDTGYVTLDALRWAESEGISISQFSSDGKLIMSSSPSNSLPHIRMAQHLVSAGMAESMRLDIVKSFLSAKLEGQASIASDIFHREDIADRIMESLRYAGKAMTMQELLGFEGKAAQSYWKAWANTVCITWTSTRILPDHWVTPFQGRATGSKHNTPSHRYNRNLNDPIAGNRGATTPINAMLNYAYTIGESECVSACYTHGLDPDIGFQHSVSPSRHALALDMMETVRPMCDRIVLDIIASTKFKLGYCRESQHGVVNLSPVLTHEISQHCIEMARVIQSHASNLVIELGSLHIPSLCEPIHQHNV